MADIEFEGIEDLSANSEVRIIALELMKIAARKRKSFAQVAREYIRNVYLLKHMLDSQKE